LKSKSRISCFYQSVNLIILFLLINKFLKYSIKEQDTNQIKGLLKEFRKYMEKQNLTFKYDHAFLVSK
jgi:hypothetical protein